MGFEQPLSHLQMPLQQRQMLPGEGFQRGRGIGGLGFLAEQSDSLLVRRYLRRGECRVRRQALDRLRLGLAGSLGERRLIRQGDSQLGGERAKLLQQGEMVFVEPSREMAAVVGEGALQHLLAGLYFRLAGHAGLFDETVGVGGQAGEGQQGEGQGA